MSTSQGGDDFFDRLPPSIFVQTVCPYLYGDELLRFGQTCSAARRLIHDPAEMNPAWKQIVMREFQLDEADAMTTLRCRAAPSIEEALPVFGYRARECLVTAANYFESWMGWTRASMVYFFGLSNTPYLRVKLNGSYILRAARMWAKLENWMDSASSGPLGNKIKDSLRAGMPFNQTPFLAGVRDPKVFDAFHAVYAFYGGQIPMDTSDIVREALNVRYPDGGFLGIMGGYGAYGTFLNSFLQFPRQYTGENVFGFVFILHEQNLISMNLAIDRITGRVFLLYRENPTMCDTGLDSFLSWMEYHANRLEKGLVGARPVDLQMFNSKTLAITLYPQPEVRNRTTEGTVMASRAVTRGVEVIASAVHNPLLFNTLPFGFIYNIRIRLLTPDDGDEYMTPEDRGFRSCKLLSRHWEIYDEPQDNTNVVDGEGVIGMYPRLFEGGYQLDHDSPEMGIFEYQSCTGIMGPGRFQGHIVFQVFEGVRPGDQTASSERFNVRVAPFLLDPNPDIWY